MSCGIGCRRGSDLALLWLWHRLVATAPVRPLAWEPPYVTGAAQEIAKRQKKTKTKTKNTKTTLKIVIKPQEKKQEKKGRKKTKENKSKTINKMITRTYNNYLKCKWTKCPNRKT